MSPPARRWAARAALLVLVPVWTWKLLEPHPVPPELLPDDLDLRLILAKSLHAGVYALLAAFAGAAFPSRGWKRASLVFLLLHGVGTEIGQTFVPNRTGKVMDVLIDWGGITAGVLATWRVWRPAVRAGREP